MNTDFLSAHKTKHLLSHVLVAAGAHRWPRVGLGESGETPTGFYADFALTDSLSDDDLASLGDDMARILRDFRSFRGFGAALDDARQLFAGQPWKQHVIERLAESQPSVGLYELDGVVDLCECAIKAPRELRAIHPEKFSLTGAAPVTWIHRGQTTWFIRVHGELFPAPQPCECCTP